MKHIHYIVLAAAAASLVSCSPAVYKAAYRGDVGALEKAIAKGGSIHETTVTGKTPLYGAAAAGQTQMVRYLVSKGAQLEAKDDSGVTALGAAKLFGQKDTEKTLLGLGASARNCGVYESPKSVAGKTIVINLNGATIRDDSGTTRSGSGVERYHFSSGNSGRNSRYGTNYKYGKTGVQNAAISEAGQDCSITTYLRFTSPNGGTASVEGANESEEWTTSGASFSIR